MTGGSGRRFCSRARGGVVRACPRTLRRCCGWPSRWGVSFRCCRRRCRPMRGNGSGWWPRWWRPAGGSVAGRRLGVWGWAFEAGTGDVRQSPAVAGARLWVEAGAELVAHDPVVGGDEPLLPEGVQVVEDPYQVAKDAAGLVVLTE